MIEFIEGRLDYKNTNYVIVEVNSIGYKIYTSPYTIDKLPPTGEIIKLYTSYQKKDNQDELYGFLMRDELKVFEKLITISEIGPKKALRILSIPLIKFKQAIINEDKKFLNSLPGIGKKLASKLILELKDELEKEFKEEKFLVTVEDERLNLALEALVNLGYTKAEAKKMLNEIREEIKNREVEEIIKLALRYK